MNAIVEYYADRFGISASAVEEALGWYDETIDTNNDDLVELMRDHIEITTSAAITELLHV
jgi:CBS-domain-containing membrane protein